MHSILRLCLAEADQLSVNRVSALCTGSGRDHRPSHRHCAQPRHGKQIHVIAIEEYVYLVPFVESEKEVFLKTIIPSRKATKNYRDRKK